VELRSSGVLSSDGVTQEAEQKPILIVGKESTNPYQRDTNSQHKCGADDDHPFMGRSATSK
jgi:hypothetical protein